MVNCLRIVCRLGKALSVLPVTLFLFFLLVPASLYADDSPALFAAPEEGWKVGLVLSGGGARGAAHIGV